MTTVAQALGIGFRHEREGRPAVARRLYLRVLRFDPTQPEALRLMAANLAEAGAHARARDVLLRVLALTPDDGAAGLAIAAAWEALGQPDIAMALLGVMVARSPDDAGGHNNLAILLHRFGPPGAGIPHWRRALAAAPGMDQAAGNLAAALVTAGRPSQALRLSRLALAIRPDSADHANNTGLAIMAAGDPRAAARWFDRATRVAPARQDLASNRLFCRHYDPDVTCDALFAAYRAWAAAQADVTPLPSRVARAGGGARRLVVGYLSADLHDHPVARNCACVLTGHDRDRFDVVLYADPIRPDGVTGRLIDAAKSVRLINGWSDQMVAERIRADGVDILVTLAGHTGRNRPRVAAYRPAPLQVWWHDLTTSGLASVDAWLTDAVLHPPGTPERFTEKLARLPCFYVHERPPERPLDPVPHPHPVVFGSFNNPAKLSDPAIALWRRVLEAVPGSRLVLKYKNIFADPLARRLVLARFGALACRVDLMAGDDPRDLHLDLLNRVDVALDPFPFSGSTTSFEALWMGVPLVTLPGERFLSRVGASLLTAIGETGWIARDAEDYARIAAALARPNGRAARERLRARVAASPLLDHPAYVRAFEATLLRLWEEVG